MANLPPINSVVKVIKTVAEQDPRLGQTVTVIQYSDTAWFVFISQICRLVKEFF